MLDYKEYYNYIGPYSNICNKVLWDRALIIKSFLNANGYTNYYENPMLGYSFMKEGFEKYQDGFKKDTHTFIVETTGNNTFYEKCDNNIEFIGKFYEIPEPLYDKHSSMVCIINLESGFCIFKIECHRHNYSKEYLYSVHIEFYNNESIHYLNNIPAKELGAIIEKDSNGNITCDSLLDLFYNNSECVKRYIIPDYEKYYIKNGKIPTTEPEMTSFLHKCLQDAKTFSTKEKYSRRRKK